MTELNWVALATVLAIHDLQLSRFGGPQGFAIKGCSKAPSPVPQQLFHYGVNPSVPQMAAAYAFGIARNHPFVNGNKRTAFVTAAVFLEDNGFAFTAPQTEVVLTSLALAAGELKEDQLAAWMTTHSRKILRGRMKRDAVSIGGLIGEGHKR